MDAVKRRNRKINTCLECRRLKRRCSRTQPCTHCTQTDRECVFPVFSRSKLANDSAASSASGDHRHQADHSPHAAASLDDAGVPGPGRSDGGGGGGGGGSAIHVARHAANDEPSRPSRYMPDMCLRIGKLSITERIGGLNRIDIIQLFDDVLKRNPYGSGMAPDDQFSAPIVAWFKPHDALPLERLLCGLSTNQLPTISLSDRQQHLLFDQFVAAVYPLCSIATMADTQGADDASAALRATMFYAAAVSMPLLETRPVFDLAKDPLVKALKAMAEDALCQVGVLHSIDLKLFQALLIYLTPQITSEVSRSHSMLLALVTRHFQLAGYHRDRLGDPKPARQLKRHLWQHLLLLNLRSAEAVGPEASLVDDPDAKLPELFPEDQMYRWQSSPSSIAAIVRYECHKVHRMIFIERENILHGRATYLATERKVDLAIIHIRETYLDKMDESDPVQKYAKVVGELLTSRAQAMIRHPQWEDARVSTMGAKLRDRSIESCLGVMEAAVKLETDPDLARWSWYAGTYQQYHSMLFPLTQVYTDPNIQGQERIMAIADHVFGPSSAPPAQRSAGILRAVRENLASFLRALNKPTDPFASVVAATAQPAAAMSGNGSVEGAIQIGGMGNHHGNEDNMATMSNNPYMTPIGGAGFEYGSSVGFDMVGMDNFVGHQGSGGGDFDGTRLGEELWFQWPPPGMTG